MSTRSSGEIYVSRTANALAQYNTEMKRLSKLYAQGRLTWPIYLKAMKAAWYIYDRKAEAVLKAIEETA